MNETKTSHGLTVKMLVIIGFAATLVLFIWLMIQGIKVITPRFASLATVAESVKDYKPAMELTLSADKTVVNSGESFQVSWTDMKQSGEFKFGYACDADVQVLVRSDEGKLVPVECTDILTLPPTAQRVFMSIESTKERFAEVELNIAFISEKKDLTRVSAMQVTVVNASLPPPQVLGTEEEATTTPPTPTPTPTPTPDPAPQPPTPTYSTSYPQSNVNGYTDLRVTTLGAGVIKNGTFAYAAKYDRDLRNVIKFDIKNIGTKTSNTWSFETTLPDGQIYKSPIQLALKPSEHVEFTLEFSLEDEGDDFVRITTTSFTAGDTNASNNTSVWHVNVDD